MSYLALASVGHAGSQYPLSIWVQFPYISYPRSISIKTADLVYLFYELDLLLPYFHSMYTDIPPFPFDCTSLWWAFGSLKGRSSRDLLEEDFWLESYLAWTCWSVQRRLLSWLPLGCAFLFRGNWNNWQDCMVTVLTTALSLQDWIQRSIIMS